MPRVAIAAAVFWMMIAGFGCKENETTFFVEHVKAQPASPGCETTSGDPQTPSGLLDVSFKNSYSAFLSVRNQLMSREEYDNLRAESAGIFVDGAEVYVQSLDGALIGGTEYYEFGTYLEPESTGIVHAILVSESVSAQLAQAYGCPEVDRKPFEPFNADLGQIYAVVRVLGHTNSGIEVETPEFSFLINICCGCLINWDGCYDPCSRFCDETEPSDMCELGVGPSITGYDCRRAFHDLSASWPSSAALECLSEEGEIRDCTCADCSTAQ